MSKYINKLQGKKVLVIGGTSGLGFCVAEAALEYGAIVFIASSNPYKVESTLTRLKSSSNNNNVEGKIFGRTIDLLSDENVKEFMNWVDGEGGVKGLDHFVFTAGDALNLKPFLEASFDEGTKSSMDVRFWGMLRAIQAAHPIMKDKANLASVTITSGTVCLKPMPGWTLASGMAGATESVSRGLAVDLAPIRVNCVVPGAVYTELWDGMGQEQKDKMMKGMEGKLLTEKMGMPEDVAEAYLFCMKSAYVTGTSIKIDGGAILSAK